MASGFGVVFEFVGVGRGMCVGREMCLCVRLCVCVGVWVGVCDVKDGKREGKNFSDSEMVLENGFVVHSLPHCYYSAIGWLDLHSQRHCHPCLCLSSHNA